MTHRKLTFLLAMWKPLRQAARALRQRRMPAWPAESAASTLFI